MSDTSESEPGGEANGWARTLQAADEIVEQLRSDGWEVVTVRAAHVAPEPPSHGDSDRFGYVYLAQGSVADDVRDAVADGDFDGYEGDHETDVTTDHDAWGVDID